MNRRLLVAFVVLLVVYQASEGLQTRFAPASLLGPALMLLALALAWPLGRWIDGSGFGAFGLVRSRWLPILAGGFVLAVLAKLAAEAARYKLAFSMQYGEMFGITAIVCAVGALVGLAIAGRHTHAGDIAAAPDTTDVPTRTAPAPESQDAPTRTIPASPSPEEPMRAPA